MFKKIMDFLWNDCGQTFKYIIIIQLSIIFGMIICLILMNVNNMLC